MLLPGGPVGKGKDKGKEKGKDEARGKVGSITERVSPRVFRVVALPTPTEREQAQIYMQRSVPHLPAGGEPVMGYCSEAQAERFLLGAPLFERILIENGIHLLSRLPYEEIPRERVELPKRTVGRSVSPDEPPRHVPERY